ncbi:MAG: hypothetical protein ACRDG7_16575 [Candidatus Limnocylindria bacterium]
MADTLTESFCERCGTRYEFQAPTRLNPLRKTRGFIGGLRNYLTSQDDLSDAMGDAMRSEEDNLASAQLEAFHESFNFCIDCRQYTCINCWNDDAGRCRSCAPIPGTDDLAERLAASAVTAPNAMDAAPVVAEGAARGLPGLEAWPMSDLPADAPFAATNHEPEAQPEVEPIPLEAEAEPEPEAEPGPELIAFGFEPEPYAEPIAAESEPEPTPESVVVEVEPAAELEPIATEFETTPEPEPGHVAASLEPVPVMAEAEPEPEPVVAELESEADAMRPPLMVVAWDEDAAYELVQPEPEPVVAEAEPEPVVAEAEPEPVVAEAGPEPIAEPEPVTAEAEPEPEVERRPRIAPISETILHFPSRPTPAAAPSEDDRAAAVIDSPEVAARRAQLDLLGLGDPGQGPVAPARSQTQPYRSRGAAVTPAELARQAALRGSFWEASAREVADAGGQVGVQSCGQCGLSLSASARFCRRCGTRQAQSA